MQRMHSRKVSIRQPQSVERRQGGRPGYSSAVRKAFDDIALALSVSGRVKGRVRDRAAALPLTRPETGAETDIGRMAGLAIRPEGNSATSR